MTRPFDLQGHRGARGLRPENTLPSFEAALDAGVSSIETDLHLSADGHVVLCHDPQLSAPLFSLSGGAPPLAGDLPSSISGLTLAQLRAFCVAGNPDPARFPDQESIPGPLSQDFARRSGFDVFAVPTLSDLFAFVAEYAGEPGARAGKSAEQRRRARLVVLDLELKRVPLYPETIGDGGGGDSPGLLERRVVLDVRAAGMLGRVRARSFDHRCVRALRCLEPGVVTGVLVGYTAPADPVAVCAAAGARYYCPSLEFLDPGLVKDLHGAGLVVLPWTCNEVVEWDRLLALGVDGITTDRPDLLAAHLRRRGVDY